MPKKSDSAPLFSPPQRPEHWHYETSVAAVEAIINRIESGELELEDVFEQFAQAVESLGQCETFLAERQSQVELLIETLGDPPIG